MPQGGSESTRGKRKCTTPKARTTPTKGLSTVLVHAESLCKLPLLNVCSFFVLAIVTQRTAAVLCRWGSCVLLIVLPACCIQLIRAPVCRPHMHAHICACMWVHVHAHAFTNLRPPSSHGLCLSLIDAPDGRWPLLAAWPWHQPIGSCTKRTMHQYILNDHPSA